VSVDHKRPLLAFAVVTVACIVIMVNAVRSDAFVSVLRSQASHVVSGLGRAPADHRPGRRLEWTPEAVPLVDAPEVVPAAHQRPATQPLTLHTAPVVLHGATPHGHLEPAGHLAPDHVAREHHAHGHGEHAEYGGRPEGRRAHGHGLEHGLQRAYGDHVAYGHPLAYARPLEHGHHRGLGAGHTDHRGDHGHLNVRARGQVRTAVHSR